MRKLIASINMTLDGFCNHTAVIADDELHENANNLLRHADAILFGRVTYLLMEDGWPPIVKNPTGIKAMDEFAVLIDNIPKVVFSKTLKDVSWKNTRLASEPLEQEVRKLKEQAGGYLAVGSPSLIVELTQLGLIDEYQLCIQPIILGSGQSLFKNITERVDLKLTKTKAFGSGAVLHQYQPAGKG